MQLLDCVHLRGVGLPELGLLPYPSCLAVLRMST